MYLWSNQARTLPIVVIRYTYKENALKKKKKIVDTHRSPTAPFNTMGKSEKIENYSF